MNNFPACRSCLYFFCDDSVGSCVNIEKVEAETFIILDPDKFFCSEHKTEDGPTFVKREK